ncbi:laminin subunit [Branchiostoma belcheri]|nr:laminin subunit [Branchiostoma belcheri]
MKTSTALVLDTGKPTTHLLDRNQSTEALAQWLLSGARTSATAIAGGRTYSGTSLYTMAGQHALVLLTAAVLLLQTCRGQVLTPPYLNLAQGRRIVASATCGEGVSEPELYCKLAGGTGNEPANLIQGQQCDYCDPRDPSRAHPVSQAVDGTEKWWQSPPLSRGTDYNKVNVTISLGQTSSQKGCHRPTIPPRKWPSSSAVTPVFGSFIELSEGSERGQFNKRAAVFLLVCAGAYCVHLRDEECPEPGLFILEVYRSAVGVRTGTGRCLSAGEHPAGMYASLCAVLQGSGQAADTPVSIQPSILPPTTLETTLESEAHVKPLTGPSGPVMVVYMPASWIRLTLLAQHAGHGRAWRVFLTGNRPFRPGAHLSPCPRPPGQILPWVILQAYTIDKSQDEKSTDRLSLPFHLDGLLATQISTRLVFSCDETDPIWSNITTSVSEELDTTVACRCTENPPDLAKGSVTSDRRHQR